MDILTILFILGWILSIVFGMGLFFLYAIMGADLIAIVQAKLLRRRLINLNGRLYCGKYLNGVLTFKKNKLNNAYVVESGDFHRMFGIECVFLHELEGIALSNEAKSAMLDFVEKYGDEELQKYISMLYMEMYLEKLRELGTINEEGLKRLHEVKEYIKNIEKLCQNNVIIKENIREGKKEVQLRSINVDAIRQYYRDMPPERFSTIAETLGYWYEKTKRTDWMNVVMPVVILMIMGALAYVIITNGNGNEVVSAANTAIQNTTVGR